MTIDPQDATPPTHGAACDDDGVGALARAILGTDGDPMTVAVTWLAGRLQASVVLFRQDGTGRVFPRATAASDHDTDLALHDRSRRHQLSGQSPDLVLPAAGHLRGLSTADVDGSFLGAWHEPATVLAGIVARVDAGTVLWVGREGAALLANDVALVADALPWLQVVLRGMRRSLAAEADVERVASALANHRDSLSAAREALDGIALAAGHELRETIRRLQGSLRLATSADIGPVLHDEFVRRAATTTDELAAQLGDMLEGLEGEARQRPHDEELVDLNGIAAWVRDTVADRIVARRARLVTGHLPTVQGSPTDLRRIMLELVVNALEHGGRFVEVVVAARGRRDDALELIVSDNGPGVSADLRATVFDPGFQTGGGAGFGLTRLRLLLQSRGGTITIAGSDEGGCRVAVVLPGALAGIRHAPQVDGAGSL